MKRRIIGLMFVLAILVMAADTAQAWGHRRCRRCCSPPNVFVVPVTKCFVFQELADFVATPETITTQNECGKFAIKLLGDPAVIATYVGEEVKFTATCTVRVPCEYYAGLHRAGHPSTYLKAVQVPLKGTLNKKGKAVFEKQEVCKAVEAELARIKFWQAPALFGIEYFEIEMSGAARIGDTIFKNTNKLILTGKVK